MIGTMVKKNRNEERTDKASSSGGFGKGGVARVAQQAVELSEFEERKQCENGEDQPSESRHQ